MTRLLALVALVLCLAVYPARAQDRSAPEPEAVLAAFEGLLGTPDSRSFFGLPPDHFWRPWSSVTLAVDPGSVVRSIPVTREVAKLLSRATGHEIDVLDVSVDQGTSNSTGLFEIIIGARQVLASEAFEKNANPAALERFETGTWPFVFAIPDRTAEPSRDGRAVVYLADDEPPRALEASLMLIAVWSLGGVTLGPELEGLVDADAESPALTPLGEAVFALFFDPRLEPGRMIPEIMAQARQLVAD